MKRSTQRRRAPKRKGGGWTTGPSFINPGNLTFNQYEGAGKDCTGINQMDRPGYISGAPIFNGVPGLRGGRRRSRRTRGGRYGFADNAMPLSSNGVGTSPGPIMPIACERGTFNGLNPNPGNIQGLMTGGLRRSRSRSGRGHSHSHRRSHSRHRGGMADLPSAFPTVQVGAADAMRYYAPNAGYANTFTTFQAPSPVPGLTIQTPYAAGSFNQACLKTGGRRSRRSRRRGGAAPFTPAVMDELISRRDFDGTTAGLPVKFGGRRRHRRSHRR